MKKNKSVRRNFFLSISAKRNSWLQIRKQIYIVISEPINKFAIRNLSNGIIINWFYEIDKPTFHKLRRTINISYFEHDYKLKFRKHDYKPIVNEKHISEIGDSFTEISKLLNKNNLNSIEPVKVKSDD
jgi:hypothetical protein